MRSLVLLASCALACSTPASPVPADFRFTDPAQAVVVGRIEMIGWDGAPHRRWVSSDEPLEMPWRVGVPLGKVYALRTERPVDGGMVADFWAVLPASPYIWDTPPCTGVREGIVFRLQPGAVNYVGTLRMHYKDRMLFVCEFSVVDEDAATLERFRASHPGVDLPVSKELAVRFD